MVYVKVVMIIVDLKPRLTYEVLIGDKSAVEIERMCSWCHEQFGMRFSIVDRKTFGRDGTWQCIWTGFGGYYTSEYKFSFDHEKDAVFFKLKWS